MTLAVVKPSSWLTIGITSTDQATCNRLNLNDLRRSDRFIQNLASF
ncbi:hypothetical protein NOS3756_53250 [Nostoc sp. NIES-3756]|nr:hypothetical protein [Nostoc sp. NIES-3756]BAT56321.1 hypothetical protein NOS3756_53250 [Nostoc sp. NIES-3756]